MTRNELIRRALLALDAIDGPAGHDTLVDAITLRFIPRPTRADVEAAIHAAQDQGWIEGITVELEGVVWQLTTKGRLKVPSLR